MSYLQIRYRGTSIALHFIGDVTPEVLRYTARFALFQAETMEHRPNAGELEYASWSAVAVDAASLPLTSEKTNGK